MRIHRISNRNEKMMNQIFNKSSSYHQQTERTSTGTRETEADLIILNWNKDD
ncbi:hypothetical protein Hanom_Chr07g00675661 [Helianthus anomalus]